VALGQPAGFRHCPPVFPGPGIDRPTLAAVAATGRRLVDAVKALSILKLFPHQGRFGAGRMKDGVSKFKKAKNLSLSTLLQGIGTKGMKNLDRQDKILKIYENSFPVIIII
jgi:hypothetical protein